MELSPQFVLSLVTVVFSVIGSYFGIKYKLDSVGAKVDAVHKRLDEMEDNYHRLDKVVDRHETHIIDLRSFKHREGDTMNAFKMAKELLAEERADRGER
jgi:predicted  nucleic acid-binding Zn-ribbon protein